MPAPSKKMAALPLAESACDQELALDCAPAPFRGVAIKAKTLSLNKFREWAQTAANDAAQGPAAVERIRALVAASPKIPTAIVSNALWRLMKESVVNDDLARLRSFAEWQNDLLSVAASDQLTSPMQESQRQFWQSFIKPGMQRDFLDGFPALLSQAWAEHDALFTFWQWRHQQTDVERAETLSLVCELVRKGAPRGNESGRALSIALRGPLGNRYCLENAVQELARESSLVAAHRAFEKALPFAVAAQDIRSVNWMLAHGAIASPSAMARAMESLARSPRHDAALLKRLLACPIDWSQCWALGLAFVAGSAANHDEKLSLARRMVEAGAPTNGPASAGAKRPEPLAGAAVFAAAPFGDPTTKMNGVRFLIANGAPPGGVNNDSAPLRLALSDNADLSPDILSFFRETGIVQPRDWRLFSQRSSNAKNTGLAETDHWAQLSQELKAQKEAEQLRRVVSAAKKKSTAKIQKASPPAQAPNPLVKIRRL